MPDELMRARHADLGVVHLVPDNDYYRSNGWSPVDESTPTEAEARSAAEAEEFAAAQVASGAVFDPSAHKVDEVNAYLASADDAERDRVLDAERAGQARKSVLGDA